MIDLIWDLFQQKNIAENRYESIQRDKQHEYRADSTESRLRELESRHEQLKLVTLALWSLLRDHSGLLESDLRKYVEKIDLLDGKRDGRVTHKSEKAYCKQCNREMIARSLACPYCGSSMQGNHVFHGS